MQSNRLDNDPLLLTLAARNELASGHADKACEMVGRAAALKGSIPARLKGQAILMAGYCAAVQNDTASAGLAADMAREEGLDTSPGLEALDALIEQRQAQVLARQADLASRLSDRRSRWRTAAQGGSGEG